MKVGIGLSIFFSLSYYLQNTVITGLSEGNWLWAITLIISFMVPFIFRADYKAMITSLILNPIFTAFLDILFTNNIVPNFHYPDDSFYAGAVRLLLKSIFEILPFLLGLFAWRFYSKLKTKGVGVPYI